MQLRVSRKTRRCACSIRLCINRPIRFTQANTSTLAVTCRSHPGQVRSDQVTSGQVRYRRTPARWPSPAGHTGVRTGHVTSRHVTSRHVRSSQTQVNVGRHLPVTPGSGQVRSGQVRYRRTPARWPSPAGHTGTGVGSAQVRSGQIQAKTSTLSDARRETSCGRLQTKGRVNRGGRESGHLLKVRSSFR